ncbi:GspE/PulE family protein [Pseudothauera lacus]|uniref:GspE/PulE family protein n=1 Tax=Pseudothauera lacus TaxID=2136175 RepID=UPI001C62688B|nr:GspE/PulE family protein [Pseudothauera lacus]
MDSPTSPAPALRSSANPASRLGDLLRDAGLLSPVQLAYALQKQAVEGQRLGSLLVQHGLALEYDVAKVLAEQRHTEFVHADDLPAPDPAVLALFNNELCLSRGFLPLQRSSRGIQVLLGDGDPVAIAELVNQRCGLPCHFVQGEFTRVAQLTRQSYYFAQNPVEDLIRREVKVLGEDIDHAYSPERLLDLLLHLAVRERATDVHITPSATSLHVLLRIDGVLRPMLAMPAMLARTMVFVKLTAEMDISEQRRPQDGSFQTTVLDMPYTVRVSTIVTEHGERMVLRLLPERSDLTGLAQLGFRVEDVSILKRVFDRPAGLVLVTGPTGSGKSTTLHAALRLQSLIERNVLTVEDPIEYRVPGAGQTEVNRRAGYEFGTALRHFLRHDPDVMLIGEIRDGETAQAAIESAATGHLVLSTLHVSSVFGVVPRLRPLGLDAQSIADNLVAVINQRLVRRNCPVCSTAAAPDAATAAWLADYPDATPKRGRGCDTCRGTGYLGRLPAYEILLVEQAMAHAIADGCGREAIHRLAFENGFRPMIEMARWMVAQGRTTPEEVRRVVGEGPHGEHT